MSTPYKHIYGPIMSRRLGVSLGVNMVPHKTCPLDCVYCECGATTDFATTRREYVSADEIICELDDFLARCKSGENIVPDYVTFGGSGEPMLNSGLGKIIGHLKKNYPSQKLALLTNSVLLQDANLRREIIPCDLILPSLDAATDEAFAQINKPAKNISCADVINGLLSLSREYAGQLWLEIFIAEGLNDSDDEIARIKKIAAEVKPHRIQINSLDRRGTCKTLRAATRKTLEKIAREFGGLQTIVEIVSRA